ncbi:MAG: hypothetical protein GY930_04385 [bacterium]|nr:hypothetical protein [bacterium]
MHKEAILCGGSSGSAMAAAMRLAKEAGSGKKFVIIPPNSVRKYLTKFMDQGWMRDNGFGDKQWEDDTCADILRLISDRSLITDGGAGSVLPISIRP